MAKRRRVITRRIQSSSTCIDRLLDQLHKSKDQLEVATYDQLNRAWPESSEMVPFYFDFVNYLEENLTN